MRDKTQVFVIHARPQEPVPITEGLRLNRWSATRGATFAIKRGKFGMFYTGIAMCGKKDNFNRKIGRTIAIQRLEKKKFWQCRKGLSSVLHDMVDLCAKHGYVLPASSVVYLEETFNGKGRNY